MNNGKKKYRVKVSYTVWDVIEVEATNATEAVELAEDKAGSISLNEMNSDYDGWEIVDDEPQEVCVSRVRFNTWTQYQRAKDFFDSSGPSRLWAGDCEDSSLTIEFCDGVTIEEMETTLREELRRANLTGYEITSHINKV